MFRKMKFSILFFVITALLLSLMVPVIAEDFGTFTIPRDTGGILPRGADFIGCKYVVTNSTNCVDLQTEAGDSLVYFTWIIGDGSGTDNFKVTTSSYTGGITNALTADYIVNASSSVRVIGDYLLNPIRVTDAYIVTNNTGNVCGILYR
jgi:hypothetical protein